MYCRCVTSRNQRGVSVVRCFVLWSDCLMGVTIDYTQAIQGDFDLCAAIQLSYRRAIGFMKESLSAFGMCTIGVWRRGFLRSKVWRKEQGVHACFGSNWVLYSSCRRVGVYCLMFLGFVALSNRSWSTVVKGCKCWYTDTV